MNLLLDTHALIWWLQDSKKLGRRARSAILRPDSEVFISSASVWEISVKWTVGRVRSKEIPVDYTAALLAAGFQPLSITFPHALAVRNLPLYHADPFDRMLIAQAQCEDLTLITADGEFAAYGVRMIDASQ